MGRGLGGIVMVVLFVLLSIYVYNKFIAKGSDSVATLGKG